MRGENLVEVAIARCHGATTTAAVFVSGPERVIASAPLEELVMRARLHDLTAFEAVGVIGVPHRPETMRDDDDRLPHSRETIDCFVDGCVTLRVDRGGRLVEDDHLRVDEQDARDRDPLTFATRELLAFVPNECFVAAGEGHDPLVDVRELRRSHDLCHGRVRFPVRDVHGDRSIEDLDVLENTSDQAPKRLEGHVPDVDSIDEELSSVEIDET